MPAMRVCSELGCHELVSKGKCPAHTRQVETRRGTRRERGYDRAYDTSRATEARRVAAGRVECWTCGERVSPLAPWHHGHCEQDRSVIHGAEHPECNMQHRGKACPHASHASASE